MPRLARYAPGGVVYHVLNRANGKRRLFKKDADFEAFGQVLLETHRRVPGVRVLDWCCMGNHWHLVLWPARDGELSAFMRYLTLTHAQRWKHTHDAVGQGHLYQDRFKSFPIQDDHHLLTVLRYVEANPLRAKVARRAEAWRWGSAFVRERRDHPLAEVPGDWPIERPRGWLTLVNRPLPEEELDALRVHVARGRPFGDETWTKRTARRLNLAQTLRPRGRPLGWRKDKTKRTVASK